MDLFNMQGSGPSKWAWKSLIILVGLPSFLMETNNVCARQWVCTASYTYCHPRV